MKLYFLFPLHYLSGSAKAGNDDGAGSQLEVSDPVDEKAQELVGTMSGDLQGLVEEDDDDDEEGNPRFPE